jgi:hypothetical protein
MTKIQINRYLRVSQRTENSHVLKGTVLGGSRDRVPCDYPNME